MNELNELTCKPLSDETWGAFVELFGLHGADGGCWCMFFRETSKEYKENSGEKNKELMHNLVKSENQIGLMAFAGSRAVGWCAVAPRDSYPRINSSPDYISLDEIPVWAITCFFTAKDYRNKGVTKFLIQQAIAHVKYQGVQVLEAYPTIPKEGKIPDDEGYTGFYDVFIKTGFKEVIRRTPDSPILRYIIN